MSTAATRPGLVASIRQWIDGSAGGDVPASDDRIDWVRVIPFLLLHLGCLGVIWVGVSPTAVLVAAALYLLRMFLVTGFYHRYFSHRTFRTSRAFAFLMALLGCTACQRGPLWWAAHHRHHHGTADGPEDLHSPRRRGFLWSHTLWFLTRGSFPTRHRYVRDWARFRELRWLDRFDLLPFLALGALLYGVGAILESQAPSLGTSGAQLLVWGWCISTIALFHATYTINSVAHRIGRRRFETPDDSRNNALLAVITLGEGWHNNHHHYPGSVRQGFYWWEIDLTWYALLALERLGLVWDLRGVPPRALERGRVAPRPLRATRHQLEETPR